jgi:hypothetical protein
VLVIPAKFRNRSRQPWLPQVLIVVVTAAVTAGIFARGMYTQSVNRPISQATATMQSAVPSAAAGAVAGSTAVALSIDAQVHPLRGQIRSSVQSLFNAINDKDYSLYSTVVMPNVLIQTPRAQWQRLYRTTQDTSITIARISEVDSETTQVMISFTSHQSVGDAPDGAPATCINWRVVYKYIYSGGTWKLGQNASYTPEYDTC